MRLRIGMGTGPVVAGVIGRKKFAYDLWGAAVDGAVRLATFGQTGSIAVDDATFKRLKDSFHFRSLKLAGDLEGGSISVYELIDAR